MLESEFFKNQNPICTKFPLYPYISDDYSLYSKLKARSYEDFGENLLGRKCPNRFHCSLSCAGRPIPKYPELSEFISKLPEKTEEGIYKGKQVWIVKAILCDSCPFKSSCTSICGTVSDFMYKHESEGNIDDERLVSLYELPDAELEAISSDEPESIGYGFLSNTVLKGKAKDSIPWDCLTQQQVYIIQARTYTAKDQDEIAKEMGISQKQVSILYDKGIQRLKEFLKAREVLRSKREGKLVESYYLLSLSPENIAIMHNVSLATVSRAINTFKTINNI